MFDKKLLKIEDENLVVHVNGETDRCLIFLSGWGTPYPLADMYQLALKFSEQYQVIILQRFGYGDSAKTLKERTPEIIANEINSVVKHLKLENKDITLVGHSTGGLYAYIFSALYPKLCHQVIMLDAVPLPKTLFYPNYLIVIYAKLLEKLKIIQKMSDVTLARMINLDTQLPNEVRKTALDFGRKNPFNPVVTKELKPMIQSMDRLYQKYLPNDRTRIISIVRQATYSRAKIMEKNLKHICDYKVSNVGKSGHYIHLNHLEFVFSEIDKFLNEGESYGKR